MNGWFKSLPLLILLLPGQMIAAINFFNSQLSVGYYNKHWFPWHFPALPKPLFWNSRYQANQGVMLSYAYTKFHTKKYFSVNLGISFSAWGYHTQTLIALSGLFELRLWLFNIKKFRPYLFYSIAGPTLISKNRFAGSKLGGYFLFQDYLGAGIVVGDHHPLSLEAKIIHYSNGDLAVYNQGLEVPFVLSLGVLF